jgi:hypothetical protein
MRAADSGPFDLTARPRISEHTELVGRPPSCPSALLRVDPVGSIIQERSQPTPTPGGLPQRFPVRGCSASSIQSADSRRGSGLISGLTRFPVSTERPDRWVGPGDHSRRRRPIRGPPRPGRADGPACGDPAGFGRGPSEVEVGLATGAESDDPTRYIQSQVPSVPRPRLGRVSAGSRGFITPVTRNPIEHLRERRSAIRGNSLAEPRSMFHVKHRERGPRVLRIRTPGALPGCPPCGGTGRPKARPS